jgi:predicted Zn-dependent peptidase
MRRIIALILFLTVLIPVAYGGGFSDKVKEFTLSNGMRFLVYERPQTATFAGMIQTKVGSVDEPFGWTGLAHFFEHMAFKGTPVIGTKDYAKEKPILDEMDVIGDQLSAELMKGPAGDQAKIKGYRDKLAELQKETLKYVVKDEIDRIYAENGGEFLNASTGNDTTQFFVMLPSNRLELWFLVESERFKNPVLREFYSERDVVTEERRMGEDNDPDGFLEEEFNNVAFVIHPYRHPVVGYMEDVQTLTKSKALQFYKTFYVPNNMTAAIVGNVRYDEVKKLAEKYFGDFPRGNEPPRQIFLEPKQKGERRLLVKFDAEPRLMIGYHMPAFPGRDNLVLRTIAYLLSRGDSSRLVRDLVTNKKLAVQVSTMANDPGARYPSLFLIYAQSRHPHTTAELETAIYEHLDKLKKEPVAKDELDKVLNIAEATLYRSSSFFGQNIFLAMRILNNVVLYGDVDADFKRVEAMKTVTPQEILDTAQRTFDESNRTVGVLVRKEHGGEK